MPEPEIPTRFTAELERLSEAMETQGLRYLILVDEHDETATMIRHNEADLARWFDCMISEHPEYALTLMSAFSEVQEKVLRACLDSASMVHPQHENLVGLSTQPISPYQFAINWFEAETLEPRGVGLAVLVNDDYYIPYDYREDGVSDEDYQKIPEAERLWVNLTTRAHYCLLSITSDGPQFTPVE